MPSVPLDALALALAAAAVHATWNLILSGAEDTHSATAVAVLAGALLFGPAAAATWRLPSEALPYALASSALELIYLVLLASAYSVAAMGFVYPVARGVAPVLVLSVGAVFLSAHVDAVSGAGVVLVAAGIVLVRGLRTAARTRDLGLALAIGGCIAAYTLLDKRGVARASPLAYLELAFGLTAVGYVLGAWRRQGARALRAALGWRPVVAGAGFFGAYAFTLAALKLAPAAPVAAVRESSVLMAAVALAVEGRERASLDRLGGAALVVAGIALVSLG